jgi:hypothetical protein
MIGLGLSLYRPVVLGGGGGGGGGSQRPANLVPPTITFSGTTITCDPGVWTNNPTSFIVRHTLNGTGVVGATSLVWNAPASAFGSLFGCEVVGVNSAGQSMPALAQEVYIGILDVIPVNAYPWDLKKLRASQTWAAIVRNGSNNPATQDKEIGFTATGNFDETALLAHCGTGNGTFVELYGQSDNNIHAVQAIATQQPRIVTNGVVEKMNGHPAMRFFRANSNVMQTSPFNLAPNRKFTATTVFQQIATANYARIWVSGNNNFSRGFLGTSVNGNGALSIAGGVSTFAPIAPIVPTPTSPVVVSQIFGTAGQADNVNAVRVDGGVEAVLPGQTGSLSTDTITIGNNGSTNIEGLDGYLASLIFLSGDVTPEQQMLLEQNRAAKYEITAP